jgi:hypothetical protein
VSYDSRDVYFRTADLVHPSADVGVPILQAYIAAVLRSKMTADIVPAGPEILVCSVPGDETVSGYPATANAVSSANPTITDLVDRKGNVLTGATVTLAGFNNGPVAQGLSSVNSCRTDPLHFYITGHYHYTTTPASMVFDLGAEYADWEVVVRYSGTRNAVASDRITKVTVGTEVQTLDATLDPPQQLEIPAVLNSSGQITVSVTLNAGSSNAYMSAVLLSLGERLQRYFAALVNASLSRFNIPTVTLAANFKLSFKAYLPSVTNQWLMQGTGATSENRIGINGGNNLIIQCGATLSDHGDVPGGLNGRLVTFVIERVAGVITPTVDGVAMSAVANAGILTLTDLGAWAKNSAGMNGILADVRIEDAGTLIRSYPLNEDADATAVVCEVNPANNGTRVNVGTVELFQRNAAANPQQWENATQTVIMPI